MFEIVGNLHAHTIYSDGAGTHDKVAEAAIRAGLDFVVTTDHNVLVGGVDGYYSSENQRVLLLTGEEIHDLNRQPMKNHLLVYGVDKELAHLAGDPQTLIDEIQNLGGLSFLAHPIDQAAPLVGEGDLSWVDWQVEGFTGLELWNFGAQYKALLTSWSRIIYYTLFPSRICSFPFTDTFRIWDGLLKEGNKISVIGGADAHGNTYHLGPVRRTIFPYEFLFKNINTHILLEESLSYDVEKDRAALYHALGNGRCFVANDGVAPANGFRFTAEADDGEHQMGSTIESGFGMTLKIRLPAPANIRLIKDGDILKDWQNVDAAIFPVSIPGSYRVEAIVGHGNRSRGWIYSNPIYLSI